MHFQQFLTEVSTSDIIAFTKAVEAGELEDDKLAVRKFFIQRGYKEVGYGLFAEVLRSTEHFVVKIASGDSAFDSYVKMVRSAGRTSPHFPRIIMQKDVGDDVKVFFIERLVHFSEVNARTLSQHHTKEDAGMFVWLSQSFHGSSEGDTVMETAKLLDLNFRPKGAPQRPDGDASTKDWEQWYVDSNVYQKQFRALGVEMLSPKHPFFKALKKIQSLNTGLDMHSGNIMIRLPTYDVVFTDPVV